uniref:Immunoglobulin V-set domain-containing protein n=1 Tax=Sparus aurata TaxID=8175 RepID=A0A671U3D4_SPAAU
ITFIQHAVTGLLWAVSDVSLYYNRYNEESSLEDSTVTLSYTYSKQGGADYVFWYRQYPGKPPEFLISHSGTEQLLSDPVSRLSFNVKKRGVILQISSAAVTDSAVYYCAVRPTVTGNTKALYKTLRMGEKDNLSHSHVNMRQVMIVFIFTGTDNILTFRLLSLYSRKERDHGVIWSIFLTVDISLKHQIDQLH